MSKETEDLFLDTSMDVYTVASESGQQIVHFSEEQSLFKNVRPVADVTVSVENGGTRKMVQWGENNLEPVERECLIMDNNIVPELLRTKRDMILGAGVILQKEEFVWDEVEYAYRRKVNEMPMPPAMRQWLEDNDHINLLQLAASELVKHNNIFAEYLENGGGQVASVMVHEAIYVRAEKSAKVSGRPQIANWLVSGNWALTTRDIRERKVAVVANHNPKDKRQTKYIRRLADEMFGGPYYFSPGWWGSKIWIKLANCIPLFHLQNLKNGYLIRYHIQFPKDYFVRIPEGKAIQSLTAEQKKEVAASATERKRQFMEKLNEILVGVKNAGRTIFTTYDIQAAVGGQFPGVKIEAVAVDLKDKALLDLFDKSNDANVSAQGILPSISGVATQGKLSSGSDIKNATNFYLGTKVQQQREIVFDLLNYALKKNGWLTGELEGAKLWARDVVMVTQDKNPAGMQAQQPDGNTPA